MNQTDKIATEVEKEIKSSFPKMAMTTQPANRPRVENVTTLLEEAAASIVDQAEQILHNAQINLESKKACAEHLRKISRAIQDAIGIGR